MTNEINAIKVKADFTELDKLKDKFGELKNEIPGATSAVDTFGDVAAALETPLVAVGLALGAALTGAIALAFKAIELGDELNDLSTRTGKSVEYLQALGDVAEKSGSNLNSLVDALDSVRKKSTAGDEEGKKVANAYEFLGISARDASGHLKDAAVLAGEGADALERMGHSADATAAFQDAFGSSALKVLPTLVGLNEELDKQYDYLASVGALMDTNLSKASDNYNDKMHDLGSAFSGLGNDIARQFLPLLTGLADTLINSAKNSGILGVAFDALRAASFLVVGALKGLLTAFLALDTAFANVVQSISLGGKVIWAALTGEWDNIPKLWEDYKARIVSTNTEAAKAVAGIWSTVDAAPVSKDDFKKNKTPESTAKYDPYSKPDTGDKGPKDSGYAAELLKEEDALIKLRAAYSQLYDVRQNTHVQLLQAKIDNGDFSEKTDATGKVLKKAATEQQLATLMQKAADADMLNTLNAKVKAYNEEWKAADQVIKAEQDKVKAARQSNAEADITRAVMQKYGATQDDVNIAISQYNIAQAQTALAIANASGATEQEVAQLQAKLDALKEIQGLQMDQKDNNDAEAKRQQSFSAGWTKAFKDYEKSANDSSKTAGDMFNSVTSNMGNALSSFVTTGKLDFKGLAASILSDLAKIAAEKAVAGLVGTLFADGGAFSGGTQFFADGGVVSSPTGFALSGGRLGVMGEAGPEAIMPLTRGADGKLGVKGGGVSGASIVNNNISVSIGTVDSDDRKNELLREIQRTVVGVAKATISDEKRPGGMLYAGR